MEDDDDHHRPSSLAEERRQITRSRIRRAAIKVLAKRGFDATVEEIANEARVSTRTIFRHYESHDRLILNTVKDMFRAYGRRPAEQLPDPSCDLEGWIEQMALTIHTRNVEILGEAFWDIYDRRHTSSEALKEVDAKRRDLRLGAMERITALTWRAAGGVGEPPRDLRHAFALNFSAFATRALMVDYDLTPADIGALTADMVKLALRRAIEEQDRSLGIDRGELAHDSLQGRMPRDGDASAGFSAAG